MTQASPSSSQPSRLRRYLVRGVLAVLVLGLLGGTGFVLFMKIKFADFQPPQMPANVVVSPVSKYEFKDTIEAIGTTVASESAVLTSTVTETIKSITAEEGSFVEKGTPIVALNDAQEQATLHQASKSYDRYNKLVKDNIIAPEKRDSEQANLDVARAQVDKRRIVAPFDGYLGLRHVNVGDIVQPGTVITTIDVLDPIKLDFTVPEIYLAALTKDMPIEATTAAYPDVVFKGRIYVIDSRIDPDSRALTVRATLANPDARLKPGLLMAVKIIRETKKSLAVPEESIMAAGERRTVFVVGADKKVSEKEIKTGQREPGLVEVLSGLSQGDKVIVEGQMKTGAGADVNVVGEKYLEDVLREEVGYAAPRKQEMLEKQYDLKPEVKQGAKEQTTNAEGDRP